MRRSTECACYCPCWYLYLCCCRGLRQLCGSTFFQTAEVRPSEIRLAPDPAQISLAEICVNEVRRTEVGPAEVWR